MNINKKIALQQTFQYTEYELTGNLESKVDRDNVDREATNFRLLEVFLHFALNTSQFRGDLQKDETTKGQKRQTAISTPF